MTDIVERIRQAIYGYLTYEEVEDEIEALRNDSKRLAALVMELAEAVDNAADDIGGSRPQMEILRDAVHAAEAIDAAMAKDKPC